MNVGVDLVLFTVRDGRLLVLLGPGREHPALPGALVGLDEPVERAARRVLREQTGFASAYLEQLYTFGDPRRVPGRRTVSVAYFALLRSDAAALPAGAGWRPVRSLPPLAFDHGRIIRAALARLRAKLSYSTVGFQLLPRAFTLTELQRLYEVILARRVDKRNFRKKILSTGLLKPVPGRRASGPHRPAQLFAFRTRKIRILDGLIV
jgi:8-oxo-dGTP diphosphatase